MTEYQKIIQETAARAGIRSVCGVRAPAVNCTAFVDEVCAEILKNFPNAPFAACWHECADGSQEWTLRSRGNYDVGQLVERTYGGRDAKRAKFIVSCVDIEKLIDERDLLLDEVMGRSVV